MKNRELNLNKEDFAEDEEAKEEKPRYSEEEYERLKEIGPDTVVIENQRWRFRSPITVGQLRELGLDTIHDSFLPCRDGFPGEQETWEKVDATMKHIKEDNPPDEEVVRPLQNEDDDIYLKEVEEIIAGSDLANELKERGFEYVDQVKVSDIAINEVIKRPIIPEKDGSAIYIGGNQGIPFEANGTIELDAPILLDGPRRFKWRIEWTVEIDFEKQLRLENVPRGLIDKESLAKAREEARRPFSQTQVSIDFEELTPKERRFNVSDARDVGSSLTKKQKELVEKFGLRDIKPLPEDEKKYQSNLGATLGQNIGTGIALEVRDYIEKEFNPTQHLEEDKQGVAYEIMSRISKLKEQERDQLFVEGLAKGDLDSMFLYTGEGAEHFIKILESEQYKISDREAALIKKNNSKLVEGLKDSEIYDLGSGDARKTKLLLERLIKKDKEKNIIYHPVDDSVSMINAAAMQMGDLSQVTVKGHKEDFRNMDKIVPADSGKNSFLILGRTLGNYDPSEQQAWINSICRAMKPGESLVVGVELKRDLEQLKSVYDTAEDEKFAKLVLQRCGVSPDQVDYEIETDIVNNRLNMKLTFNQETPVNYKEFNKTFTKGESIRIAVSHKYKTNELDQMLNKAGLSVTNKFENKNHDYQLVEAKFTERKLLRY